MLTLYDVARRAAVSTATVSRVVHGQDRVREATRIRVLQAIDELSYVPDGADQSLSRRRKDIIGMVCIERGKAELHDVETECPLYYDEVQRGVQARIRDSQWLLLGSFMQADGAGEPDLSRLNPLSGKVDGILIGEGFAASRYIQRLAARLPVVVIAGTLGAQAADVVAAGRGRATHEAPRGAARRRGVRQRPDGNRGPADPHSSRRPRPRRGRRDRLRRHLSRPPG